MRPSPRNPPKLPASKSKPLNLTFTTAALNLQNQNPFVTEKRIAKETRPLSKGPSRTSNHFFRKPKFTNFYRKQIIRATRARAMIPAPNAGPSPPRVIAGRHADSFGCAFDQTRGRFLRFRWKNGPCSGPGVPFKLRNWKNCDLRAAIIRTSVRRQIEVHFCKRLHLLLDSEQLKEASFCFMSLSNNNVMQCF